MFFKATHLFKCSLACLALKVYFAHLLTKKPSLRSMRVAEVQCVGPTFLKALGYEVSYYKSTCRSTVYNKH